MSDNTTNTNTNTNTNANATKTTPKKERPPSGKRIVTPLNPNKRVGRNKLVLEDPETVVQDHIHKKIPSHLGSMAGRFKNHGLPKKKKPEGEGDGESEAEEIVNEDLKSHKRGKKKKNAKRVDFKHIGDGA
ncbi:hypothetical protein WICPIJ_006431 [Wickerhamomyces pijperi]|uniref:Uncharacterized protein n=1 Tax=Wickerhamomyces pijperi TaxID=599730 RepID=A0A9P8Q231_WICPI|nr:hypothetical protein WICPIJ_006431 [Wickerhamomyces pijperi]